MTIRYSNGYQIEGALLRREAHSMRIALKGSEDVLHLNDINGTWVSEDCEPVHVDFEWMKNEALPTVTLDDCICSKELAAHLLHLLFSGNNDATAQPTTLGGATSAPLYQQVV